ncbi:imm11 family protein [Pirellulaceae bacterium SH449]
MKKDHHSKRRYYTYEPDSDEFAGVTFVDSISGDDGPTVADLHWQDTRYGASWRTLKCIGFDDNPLRLGDFPSVSDYNRVPMMSSKAWNALRPVIETVCERLPVKHPFPGEYFLIHVLRTIDALDENLSEVERRSFEDPRIRRVLRYAFKHELIDGAHIFKLPNKSGSELIVDDVFRRTTEERGLQGLIFRELPMAMNSSNSQPQLE